MSTRRNGLGNFPDFEGALGVILASSSVPRVMGEIGNPHSNPPGTLYETTTFEDFLSEMGEGLHPASLARLIACRDVLVDRGAECIATSCGLLWPAQAELQFGCPVPFVSSSLCLLDRLRRQMPKGICVVTLDAGFLPYWLRVQAQSLENVAFCELGRESYLYGALTGRIPAADFSAKLAERSVLARLRDYLSDFPETNAFLLECTNLSPYAPSIRTAFKRPVYDIYDAVYQSEALTGQGSAHRHG